MKERGNLRKMAAQKSAEEQQKPRDAKRHESDPKDESGNGCREAHTMLPQRVLHVKVYLLYSYFKLAGHAARNRCGSNGVYRQSSQGVGQARIGR
jgi:hypothetical protein